MKFTDVGLEGAWLVEHAPAHDERGSFTEVWERETFAGRDLIAAIDQVSSAHNTHAFTLRGMHFQTVPFTQTKLVSCIAGAIFDVMIDLRPQSPSFKRWFGCELRAGEPQALYIPAGFAHGYLTLQAHSTVHYLIAGKYSPQHARGVRWDDPAFGIRLPAAPAVISPRDALYPDFMA